MIGRSPRRTHGSPPLDEPPPTAPRADQPDPPPEPDPWRAAEPRPAAPEPAAPEEPAAPDPSGPGPAAPRDEPPGLRAQIGATKDATQRLVSAHIELAKAEIGEVADEIKRIAILVGIAIGVGIAAGLLLSVGLPLFLGEWIFGSIGWGLLHGLLFLVAVGATGIVMALRVGADSVTRSIVVGLLTGILVGVLFGLNLTNRAWRLLGDSVLPLTEPAPRALATAAVVLPVVLALLIALITLVQAVRTGTRSGGGAPGVAERIPVAVPTSLYVGWLAAFIYAYTARLAWPELAILGVGVAGFVVSLVIVIILGIWRPGYALTTGLAIGTLIGVPLAGLTALGLGPRVGAAIGVTVGLITWIGMLGAEVARRGVDTEALMKRFIPQKTIDTTKETIEWARKRTPLSRKS